MKLPDSFKEFSIWLNPSNLSVFRKIELLKMGTMALGDRSLPPPLEIQKRLSQGLSGTLEDRGIFTLRLYFYQIMTQEHFCLDLRKVHFRFIHDHWNYSGELLAHRFSPHFLNNLRGLYNEYYRQDTTNLRSSLQGLGIIDPTWSEKQQESVEQLFIKHFNQGDKKEQYFSVDILIESFKTIFLEIKRNNGKIPSEFGLFGIFLTSLYLNLSESKKSFDVNNAFMDIIEIINSSSSSRP